MTARTMTARTAPARLAVALAFALACLTLAGCGGSGGDTPDEPTGSKTLTVYSSFPLYGPSRRQSEDVVNAIKLALEAAGGKVGPFKVNYVSLNATTPESGEGWERDQVVANARRALSDRNTIAYLGELHSAASAVSLPLLNQGGILQVSPSNTYVGLTRLQGARRDEPDRFYPSGARTYGRVVPADHVQAGALAAYMRAAGVKRLFIADDRELYGTGLAALVRLAAQRRGIEVVGEEGLDPRAADLGALGREVAGTDADGFLFAGLTENRAVDVFRAVHDAAAGLKLFGGDGVAESAFAERLGPGLARRVYLTSPTLDARRSPAAAGRFEAAFRRRFGREPQPYAIYGYEAMQVALAAVERAGVRGNEREAVIDAFFATHGRDSVLGRYSIDENGDTTLKRYAGNRISDGRLVFDRLLDGRR